MNTSADLVKFTDYKNINQYIAPLDNRRFYGLTLEEG